MNTESDVPAAPNGQANGQASTSQADSSPASERGPDGSFRPSGGPSGFRPSSAGSPSSPGTNGTRARTRGPADGSATTVQEPGEVAAEEEPPLVTRLIGGEPEISTVIAEKIMPAEPKVLQPQRDLIGTTAEQRRMAEQAQRLANTEDRAETKIGRAHV